VRRRLLPALLVAFALAATACGSSTPTTTAKAALDQTPLPAGRAPSHLAVMVCLPHAQHEIEEVLGVTATIEHRTWQHHLYTCRYDYPDGTMVLSIKELSSWNQTEAYFHGLGAVLGDTGSLGNLGQGAFRTSNGDVVVRKDWKVLLVDTTGLPATFGKPPTSRSAVAFTVADLILECWSGD
jgi:hypothetical protein